MLDPGECALQFREHLVDIVDPRPAGHCIGVFGVDQDKIPLKLPLGTEMADGGRGHLVGRKDRCDGAGGVGIDKRQILCPLFFKPDMDPVGKKPFRRADSSLDAVEFIHI